MPSIIAAHIDSSVMAAPAAAVYDILAVPEEAARMSPTVVHVERCSGDDSADLVQRWVVDKGQPRTWQARRELDRANGRIIFTHEQPPGPIAATQGQWSVRPLTEESSLVELRHEWTLAGDGPKVGEQVRAKMARGGAIQLAGLRGYVEQRAEVRARESRTERYAFIPASAEQVMGFLWDLDDWAQRMSNVRAVTQLSDSADCRVVQVSTEEDTEPIQLCYVRVSASKVVWKQIGGLPAMHRSVRGELTMERVGNGIGVVARRTDGLDPAALLSSGWDDLRARAEIDRVRRNQDLDLLAGALDAAAKVGTPIA